MTSVQPPPLCMGTCFSWVVTADPAENGGLDARAGPGKRGAMQAASAKQRRLGLLVTVPSDIWGTP